MTGTEVTTWEDRLKKDAKEVVEAYRPDIGRLSFDQGILRYEDVQVPENKIQVVVLAAAFANLFYKREFVKGAKYAPPDCYALSLDGRGMAPSDDVLDKQNDVCLTCQNLQWGSDPKGGRGKACKEKMRMVVLPASHVAAAESTTKGGVATFTLPVMSVNNWKLHAQKVAISTGGGYWGAVSQLKLVPDKKAQYVVEWELVAKLEDKAVLSALAGRLDWAASLIMQPYAEEEAEEKPADTGKKKKY